MGWNESPAYSCAATETTQDGAHTWIGDGDELSAHLMELLDAESSKPPTRRTSPETDDLKVSAVYVDDFLQMAVQDTSGKRPE
jgi:hypothetical protein